MRVRYFALSLKLVLEHTILIWYARFTKNTSQNYILNFLEQYGNYVIEVEGETINLNGKNTQVKIIIKFQVDLGFEKQFGYLDFTVKFMCGLLMKS